MRHLTVLCLLAAGCSSSSDPSASPDAPSPPASAGTTAAVYLNFEGATLSSGNEDDATSDRSSLVDPGSTKIVPPYLAGVAGRDAIIDATFAGIRDVLAPYAVEVVRTRPADGTYTMIVFGGDGAAFASAKDDCGDATPSNVSFVTDLFDTAREAVYGALFDLGTNLGLAATIDAGNCMCINGACIPQTGFCTFTAVAHGVAGPCGAAGVQDQLALLTDALGAR